MWGHVSGSARLLYQIEVLYKAVAWSMALRGGHLVNAHLKRSYVVEKKKGNSTRIIKAVTQLSIMFPQK